MTLKRRLITGIAWFTLVSVGFAIAGSSTIDVKDAAGNTKTYAVRTDGSGNFLADVVLCDGTAGANCAAVKAASTAAGATDPALVVAISPNNTVAVTQSGTWTVQPGNTANTTAWKVDGSAVTQPVSGTVAATQSGAWNITNVSGTVSLPTGAATAAKQPALGTAGSASTDVITVQGIASGTALTIAGTVTANAGTNLNTSALALESGGNLATLAGAVSSAKVQSNTAQIAGTTTDTNSGNKSAGTQRIVIATDQPQLTNALKVDGSAVTQPVSGAVTVSGTATVSGTVTALTAGCAGQTEANTTTTPINLTGSGRIITGVSAQKVRICALNLVSATAQNIALVEGTGSTCGTSTAGMAGGATAATGWNLAANGGLTYGNGLGTVYKTATNADDVCLLLSSSGQTSGSVTWTSF